MPPARRRETRADGRRRRRLAPDLLDQAVLGDERSRTKGENRQHHALTATTNDDRFAAASHLDGPEEWEVEVTGLLALGLGFGIFPSPSEGVPDPLATL